MKTSEVIKITSCKIVQFFDTTTNQIMWHGLADVAPFWCWSRPFVSVNNGLGTADDPVQISVIVSPDYYKFLTRLGVKYDSHMYETEHTSLHAVTPIIEDLEEEPRKPSEDYEGMTESEAFLIHFKREHPDRKCSVAEWFKYAQKYQEVHNERPSASGWSILN